MHLSVRAKILAIRLSEKISKNPEYAKQIGVEMLKQVKTDKLE